MKIPRRDLIKSIVEAIEDGNTESSDGELFSRKQINLIAQKAMKDFRLLEEDQLEELELDRLPSEIDLSKIILNCIFHVFEAIEEKSILYCSFKIESDVDGITNYMELE